MPTSLEAKRSPSVIRPRSVGVFYYAALWAIDIVSLCWLVMRTLGRRHTPDIRILVYHEVGEMTPQEDPLRISISAELFEQHVRFLREEGYRFLTVEQASVALAGEEVPERAIVLSFDDAHASVGTMAAPVLKRYGVPATLFVPVEWLGESQFPWTPSGSRFSRPLTWHELQRLTEEIDLEIGSHTMTHRPLHTLSKVEQETEVLGSRRTLEERLGRPVRVFAYPYGGWGTFPSNLHGLLREHGYVAACTNVMGVNHAGVNPMALRRIRIGWCDTLWRFRLKLAGVYDWSDQVRAMFHFRSRREAPRPETV